jgi:hypothetical protein
LGTWSQAGRAENARVGRLKVKTLCRIRRYRGFRPCRWRRRFRGAHAFIEHGQHFRLDLFKEADDFAKVYVRFL